MKDQDRRGVRMLEQDASQMVTKGEPWTPGSEGLLVVHLQHMSRGEYIDIKLAAHVRPYRIPLGGVIRSTYYLASTGARFVLIVAGARFCSWTREHQEPGKQTLEEKKVSGVQFNPKLRVQFAGPGSAEAATAMSGGSTEVVTRAEFQDTPQAILSDRCIGGRELEWQYALHRGAKRVRDYLDETLHLWARCECDDGRPRQIRATAALDDCGFFGPDRRVLGEFKAFALRLKLRRKGIALPSTETVIIDVKY